MTISSQLLHFVKDKDGICYWCKKPVSLDVSSNHELAPSREHLKPISKNGKTEPGNLVLAHRGCSNRRGSMSPTDFLKIMNGEVLEVKIPGPSHQSKSHERWASMRDFWPTDDKC